MSNHPSRAVVRRYAWHDYSRSLSERGAVARAAQADRRRVEAEAAAEGRRPQRPKWIDRASLRSSGDRFVSHILGHLRSRFIGAWGP